MNLETVYGIISALAPLISSIESLVKTLQAHGATVPDSVPSAIASLKDAHASLVAANSVRT